ncbi:hypothetical protein Tco_0903328 [Tanacetum coccineum]
MAQTDMLERFENLLVDYDALAETHSKCSETVQKLVDPRMDLDHNAKLYNNAINRYQALKEEHAECEHKLEAEVAKKDSTLTAAKRVSAEGAQERQRLVAQLSKTKVEKFDCICKLLPTVVSRLLKSHEYKKSILEPFNMAIQAGWGKGLSEGRTDKEIMAKEYLYIENIASGYHHSVVDLVKVHPDPAPFEGTSAPTISQALGASGASSLQKKT